MFPYRHSAPRFLAATLVLVSLAGCGSDSPADPNGGGGGNGRTVKENPSFAADVQEILQRQGCTSSGCHGSAPRGSLDLRPAAAWSALVGVPAVSEPVVRVIPGNPEGSYLVMRVEGRQQVGSRMPPGGSPLDAVDLQNIRNWIARGAQNN